MLLIGRVFHAIEATTYAVKNIKQPCFAPT